MVFLTADWVLANHRPMTPLKPKVLDAALLFSSKAYQRR